MQTAYADDAEKARAGICHHAEQCVEALQLAQVAEFDLGMEGIPEGLRKLAAYHSYHAFRWARSLQVGAA